ncbi:hypothetical protein SAICODRAFT_51477 [Saitoella complicata NRRL Y-17804]|uniref:uncharacterized protein n=1 Tax=Saitoella complicata (strain BCRC 22490 / CBS 7301 / JCM 7358 / NBRC 10748 / NRRL Y-17804) TaxID=698492 RepID=UPI0008670FC4|nr:uncharacterized protein SAICODRAFT_51477 [Saitoella complicata NRRL Y-17804]ODQ56123.1 hypothetical protein SAICODRAFT_51477 [Saitoella complicata NRRL Y-17804]
MLLTRSFLSLLLPCLATVTVVPSAAADRLPNANHIFAAIHSSMRQFGSSLNHNGMSFFIATVPEGTEFYHGTSKRERVNGIEWLAFEPEHAMIFARPGRGRPPGKGMGHPDLKRGGPPDLEKREESDKFGPLFAYQGAFESPPTKEEKDKSYGYLHTYRTTTPLRLLYLDGQSAAKSSKGTLDAQDLVLLPGLIDPDVGMGGDKQRADEMCRIARESGAWKGRVDGVLRMEGGFEVILCGFGERLDIVSIKRAKESNGHGPPGSDGDNGDGFNYYRAVAARYDGIGGGRVTLDYEHFVTAFTFPDAMYWDHTGRPRIRNETEAKEEVERVTQAVTQMILNEETKGNSVDWQGVVDMIIQRYADRIEYLASGHFTTLEAFQAEVDRALRPFIDYGARNGTLEVERCAAQFIPSDADTTTTAYLATTQIAHHICSTLSSALSTSSLSSALGLLQDLKSNLGWTTWKRCRGCDAHEICFLPIWPVGREEDFVQPRCRGNVSLGPGQEGGYWDGGFGRPPRGPGKPVWGRKEGEGEGVGVGSEQLNEEEEG